MPLALECIRKRAQVPGGSRCAAGGGSGGSGGDNDGVGSTGSFSRAALDCDDSAYTTAKLMVFSLCSLLAHRQAAAASAYGNTIAAVLLKVLQIPCVMRRGQETSELKKLQHGSIDTLGILVSTTAAAAAATTPAGNSVAGAEADRTSAHLILPQLDATGVVPLVTLATADEPTHRPKIVMLSDDETDTDDDGAAAAAAAAAVGDNVGDVDDGSCTNRAIMMEAGERKAAALDATHMVLSGLAEQAHAGSSVAFRVCMANVLISSTQHAARQSEECVQICGGIYRLSVNTLLACAGGPSNPTVVRAAAAQVLFTLCFRLLSSEIFDSDMIDLSDLCAALLNSNREHVRGGGVAGALGGDGDGDGEGAGILRLAGLKLLMALLGRVEQQATTALPGSTVAKLSGLLRGVAHMDPSTEARNLAAQCLRQMQVDGF